MKGIVLAALAALSFNAFADASGGICMKDDLTGESVVVTNATVAVGTAIHDGDEAVKTWITEQGYLTSYTETDPLFNAFQTNTMERAIGLGAEAKGYTQTSSPYRYQSSGGTAIGIRAKAYMPTADYSSYGNIAIGHEAEAGVNDTVSGYAPYSFASSTAIGYQAKADGQSIAIGSGVKAGTASVVIGAFDESTDQMCTVVGACHASVYGYPYFGRTAYGSQLFGSYIASTNRYATVIGYGDASLSQSGSTYNLRGVVGVSHGDNTVNFTAPDTEHFYIGGTNLCDRLKLVIDAMVTAGVMTSAQADTVKAAIK